MARRTTQLQKERYDQVQAMLVNMVPYGEIEKQMSLRWQCSRKKVVEIIKAVHDDWAATATALAGTRKHQIRNGFESLYLKATAAKDVNQAARILGELGRLDGCYEAATVNVNHAGGIGVGINLGGLGFKSADEVKARIEELRKRLLTGGPAALQPPRDEVEHAVHLIRDGVVTAIT